MPRRARCLHQDSGMDSQANPMPSTPHDEPEVGLLTAAVGKP
jgi:hypothetical protein